jgi:hypothetical protein
VQSSSRFERRSHVSKLASLIGWNRDAVNSTYRPPRGSIPLYSSYKRAIRIRLPQQMTDDPLKLQSSGSHLQALCSPTGGAGSTRRCGRSNRHNSGPEVVIDKRSTAFFTVCQAPSGTLAKFRQMALQVPGSSRPSFFEPSFKGVPTILF